MLAGFATAVAGISLIALALFGQGVLTARMALSVVVGAALLELVAGARLTRRGGPGMAHLFAGVLAVAFGLYIVASGIIHEGAMSPGPVALALGLFCLCNAVFRAIDLVVDRPAAALFESIDCAFTGVVGLVLLSHWRDASAAFIGVAAGIELVSGGLALVGSARAVERHPDQPPYEGRADRLARVKVR